MISVSKTIYGLKCTTIIGSKNFNCNLKSIKDF